ncbi:uncharacterized protein BX663DRAFT_520441 [Cokeromyces recurvatus]|uniref:uncharacterized protein n=1 Tax=Cokeromyces recurvatus TaxID=90255 RepID=UPI002220B3DF|nr:uncharacterized protein BX663DRAFT_520441 [Cokeromyces recurvatus]KAI7899553.1 hypothetical protein BX663DRAFT_520441 [Cokeromyces recurvatus]
MKEEVTFYFIATMSNEYSPFGIYFTILIIGMHYFIKEKRVYSYNLDYYITLVYIQT